MPTYQYACTACGHELEAVQSFSDDALTDCPECEGRLRKVFGSVGVVFKGSGFYRTDSRNESRNGSGKNGKNGKNGKSDSGSGSEGSGAATGSGGDSSGSGSGSGSGSVTSGGGGKDKSAAGAA